MRTYLRTILGSFTLLLNKARLLFFIPPRVYVFRIYRAPPLHISLSSARRASSLLPDSAKLNGKEFVGFVFFLPVSLSLTLSLFILAIGSLTRSTFFVFHTFYSVQPAVCIPRAIYIYRARAARALRRIIWLCKIARLLCSLYRHRYISGQFALSGTGVRKFWGKDIWFSNSAISCVGLYRGKEDFGFWRVYRSSFEKRGLIRVWKTCALRDEEMLMCMECRSVAVYAIFYSNNIFEIYVFSFHVRQRGSLCHLFNSSWSAKGRASIKLSVEGWVIK